MSADELNNLRVLVANYQALAHAAAAWRSLFVAEINEANESLFDQGVLALIRALDAMPSFVVLNGVVVEVNLARCDCRPCTAGIVEAEHCVDWHGNRVHECAGLEAMDEFLSSPTHGEQP